MVHHSNKYCVVALLSTLSSASNFNSDCQDGGDEITLVQIRQTVALAGKPFTNKESVVGSPQSRRTGSFGQDEQSVGGLREFNLLRKSLGDPPVQDPLMGGEDVTHWGSLEHHQQSLGDPQMGGVSEFKQQDLPERESARIHGAHPNVNKYGHTPAALRSQHHVGGRKPDSNSFPIGLDAGSALPHTPANMQQREQLPQVPVASQSKMGLQAQPGQMSMSPTSLTGEEAFAVAQPPAMSPPRNHQQMQQGAVSMSSLSLTGEEAFVAPQISARSQPQTVPQVQPGVMSLNPASLTGDFSQQALMKMAVEQRSVELAYAAQQRQAEADYMVKEQTAQQEMLSEWAKSAKEEKEKEKARKRKKKMQRELKKTEKKQREDQRWLAKHGTEALIIAYGKQALQSPALNMGSTLLKAPSTIAGPTPMLNMGPVVPQTPSMMAAPNAGFSMGSQTSSMMTPNMIQSQQMPQMQSVLAAGTVGPQTQSMLAAGAAEPQTPGMMQPQAMQQMQPAPPSGIGGAAVPQTPSIASAVTQTQAMQLQPDAVSAMSQMA